MFLIWLYKEPKLPWLLLYYDKHLLKYSVNNLFSISMMVILSPMYTINLLNSEHQYKKYKKEMFN